MLFQDVLINLPTYVTSESIRQAALETQDLSRTYLAQQKLESMMVTIIVIIMMIIVVIDVIIGFVLSLLNSLSSSSQMHCKWWQVAGILTGDAQLVGQSLDSDVIIEPVRGPLIPGFAAVKAAAKAAGMPVFLYSFLR